MDYITAAETVFNEYAASVEKHGSWADYTLDEMVDVIVSEFLEVASADIKGDLHGEHGVIRELAQVSACCIKAIMVLSSRPLIPLAKTLQDAVLHSEGEGCVLPASPSLHQGKESAANHPEEGTQI